jgi:hypothetical protein
VSITSSRLLSFLEPITMELTTKQKERLAQLLAAYFSARQLRVSALARGAQSLDHLSQGNYEACYKATQRFLGQVQATALRQALQRLLPSSRLSCDESHNQQSAPTPYVLLDITEVERPEASPRWSDQRLPARPM